MPSEATFDGDAGDAMSSVAYVSDHGPASPDDLGGPVAEFVRGVDVLLHDAQHTAEECPARAHFGHASAEYAVALGVAAGVGRVVPFDPNRTDAEVDRLLARFSGAPIPVTAAIEGQTIDPGASYRAHSYVRVRIS